MRFLRLAGWARRRRPVSSGQRRAMLSLTSSKCARGRRRPPRCRDARGPSRIGACRSADHVRVGAGDDERDVRPRERLERAPDPLERAVVGELDDPAVEPGIGLGDAVPVVVAGGGAHRLEVAAELGDVRVGQARDGQPAAERLERRADGVGLEDLAPRRAPDAGAAERRDLDDAERLEPAERLADRGLARPELAGDLGLDDPRIRRVVAVEDAVEDPVLDLVGQDAPRDDLGRRPSPAPSAPDRGGRRVGRRPADCVAQDLDPPGGPVDAAPGRR